MTTFKCPKCEQTVPKERAEFLQALWDVMRPYYEKKTGEEVDFLEVTVRINGEVVELIDPLMFLEPADEKRQ